MEGEEEGKYALGCGWTKEERDGSGEKGGPALMNNFTTEFRRRMYCSLRMHLYQIQAFYNYRVEQSVVEFYP